MNIEAATAEWQSLLGPGHVLTLAQAQAAYGADTGGATRFIPAALRVTDSAHLPEVMRIARRHRTPVHPISTGRNWGYGTALPPVDGCTIIDLSGLRRILHYAAELGVVTVEPGVTQGMLADFLEAGRHPYMVLTTGAGPSCSLVGNAVERGFGITPVSDHFAAVTDLEAVLADGSIYRSAMRELAGPDLARLFKWGIGPYTTGLFTQSGWGIVTRMSIALARRPERVMTCVFSLADDARLEEAVSRTRAALASLPGVVGGINLMNRHRVLAMTVCNPLRNPWHRPVRTARAAAALPGTGLADGLLERGPGACTPAPGRMDARRMGGAYRAHRPHVGAVIGADRGTTERDSVAAGVLASQRRPAREPPPRR